MPVGQGEDRTIRDNLGVDTFWSGDPADTSDRNNCKGTLSPGSC